MRLPLAVVGTALNAVPYQLVSWIGRRIHGLDQQATWKVLPALLLYPATWLAEAAAAGGLAGAGERHGVDRARCWRSPSSSSARSPAGTALLFHDRRSRLVHEVAAFLKLRTRRRFADALRAERDDVRRRVAELVELYRQRARR